MADRHRRRNARSNSGWQRIVLPLAGFAAILVIVSLVVAIILSGSDGDDGENDVAVNPDPTGQAESPAPKTAEPNPEPTPAPDESGEVQPTPVPTQPEPANESDEPASEPTPEPTPTPQPLVGDFGELPAGDMPSGSPAESMNLEYHLDMSLQNIPAQAPAYQIQPRQWTLEEAQQTANRLGVEGEVIDQGNGSFRVESETASLYFSSTGVQYIRPAGDAEPVALPANEQLTQMARTWLAESGLAGADMGPGAVLNRDEERGVAFVLIKPVEPAQIISATPSAGVTIRGDGTVTEAMVNWPQSLVASNYGLRTAEGLWSDASQGRHFVDIDPSQLPPDFSGATGTVTITDAGIAYTIAGNAMSAQYLVPVVVFSGTANVDAADSPVPVQIYVQAVSAQAAPRG